MVLLLPSGGEKKGGPDDESRIAIITENIRFALCALISWIKDRWPLTFFFFFFLERDQGGAGRFGIRSIRFNASRLIGSHGRGRESSESRGHGGTNRFIRELEEKPSRVEGRTVVRWKSRYSESVVISEYGVE